MPSRDRQILELARSIATAANAGAATGELGTYTAGLATDADELVELLEAAAKAKRARKPTAKLKPAPSRSRTRRQPK